MHTHPPSSHTPSYLVPSLSQKLQTVGAVGSQAAAPLQAGTFGALAMQSTGRLRGGRLVELRQFQRGQLWEICGGQEEAAEQYVE
jgi:hypothetical protein